MNANDGLNYEFKVQNFYQTEWVRRPFKCCYRSKWMILLASLNLPEAIDVLTLLWIAPNHSTQVNMQASNFWNGCGDWVVTGMQRGYRWVIFDVWKVYEVLVWEMHEQNGSFKVLALKFQSFGFEFATMEFWDGILVSWASKHWGLFIEAPLSPCN